MSGKTYVQLTRERANLQEVSPGELNQPIDVSVLTARKCPECGQSLPESYQPPGDEDWATGIFGCTEDPESCRTGLFCPCMLFGQNVESMNQDVTYSSACLCHVLCVEGGITLAALTAAFHGIIDPNTACLLTEGLLFAWWMCGIYTSMGRQTLQRKYHLKDSPCDACMVHCCLHWCAICQEHREMKKHLFDDNSSDTTIMDPPAAQEMNSEEKQESTSAAGEGVGNAIVQMRDGEGVGNDIAEMQPGEGDEKAIVEVRPL